jgi:L-lactate utilization protein LutB
VRMWWTPLRDSVRHDVFRATGRKRGGRHYTIQSGMTSFVQCVENVGEAWKEEKQWCAHVGINNRVCPLFVPMAAGLARAWPASSCTTRT